MDREDQADIDAERGYSTIGARELRLREWFSLREEGEKAGDFEKLTERLRVKKWVKANPAKVRVTKLRYYRKPGIAGKQIARAKQRRHEKHRAAAPVITCAECGSMFCEAYPRQGGAPRKFCSRACMQRERYQRITPGARRCALRGRRS